MKRRTLGLLVVVGVLLSLQFLSESAEAASKKEPTRKKKKKKGPLPLGQRYSEHSTSMMKVLLPPEQQSLVTDRSDIEAAFWGRAGETGVL